MKHAWYWDEVHQTVFDNVHATIAKDAALVYPDYSKEFEMYTDFLSKQLGEVITQGKRPIEFSQSLFISLIIVSLCTLGTGNSLP
jgi:hypothetical protein